MPGERHERGGGFALEQGVARQRHADRAHRRVAGEDRRVTARSRERRGRRRKDAAGREIPLQERDGLHATALDNGVVLFQEFNTPYLREKLQYLRVQRLVAAREHIAALVARTAGPVGDRASRRLDQRYQRLDVVRLQTRLDHHVDEAHRELRVAIAVAAEARQPRGSGDRVVDGEL